MERIEEMEKVIDLNFNVHLGNDIFHRWTFVSIPESAPEKDFEVYQNLVAEAKENFVTNKFGDKKLVISGNSDLKILFPENNDYLKISKRLYCAVSFALQRATRENGDMLLSEFIMSLEPVIVDV